VLSLHGFGVIVVCHQQCAEVGKIGKCHAVKLYTKIFDRDRKRLTVHQWCYYSEEGPQFSIVKSTFSIAGLCNDADVPNYILYHLAL